MTSQEIETEFLHTLKIRENILKNIAKNYV